jgi:hypothetical protein
MEALMRVLGKCPACAEALEVRRLSCLHCGTVVEGRFELSRFDRLSSEQQEFLLLFLRSRGNIRDVERELNLSYPTVRSRLDAILRTLELDDPAPPAPRSDRIEVLEALARGDLNVNEAVERLRRQP